MIPLAFLFDRNFPRPVARLVEGYERDNLLARHQDDDPRFVRTTTDVDIIRTLAADADHHWVFVSQDREVTRRPAERAAIDVSGLTFFCFGRAWFRMTTHEKAWRFLMAWPRVVETAGRHRGKRFEIEGVNLKIVPLR